MNITDSSENAQQVKADDRLGAIGKLVDDTVEELRFSDANCNWAGHAANF